MLVRQSHKKTVDASEKVVTEMGSDIKMNTNPSYEVTKQKPKQEPQYDCIAYNQLGNNHDNTKMDTNPSYGTVHCANSDVAIQDNPTVFQSIRMDYLLLLVLGHMKSINITHFIIYCFFIFSCRSNLLYMFCFLCAAKIFIFISTILSTLRYFI